MVGSWFLAASLCDGSAATSSDGDLETAVGDVGDVGDVGEPSSSSSSEVEEMEEEATGRCSSLSEEDSSCSCDDP